MFTRTRAPPIFPTAGFLHGLAGCGWPGDTFPVASIRCAEPVLQYVKTCNINALSDNTAAVLRQG